MKRVLLAVAWLGLAPIVALADGDLPPLQPPHGELPLSFWEHYHWVILAASLVAMALLVLLILWLRRSKPAIVVPPDEIARRALEALRGQPENGVLLMKVSGIFRRYVTFACGLPPREMTTTEVCRAVAMATNTVCTGEILQTQHRRNFEVSRREYFRVIEMKTAELFTLSCDLAAFLGGAEPERRATLRQFGTAFGIAYQVYDDCVDLFGTEAEAGKSLGTDLAKGKLTWPVLLAWERANPVDRKHLEGWIQDWRPEYFARVNELLVRYETFEPSL
ncbi:MAG TPA: polyprenyl synthetase family protein, partial [Verrucomicrobiae bacterium]|nr:polyprenyl synthetase family protein [Verrucomicrobiae bacterium]